MSGTSSGSLERYDALMRLADVFDDAGAEMRTRAGLGEQVLRDPAVSESAPLSPPTWDLVDDELRAATTGKQGLLARSVELDADALVIRATVLTYRWIDELEEAAYRSLGSIAGRAIGYLAPQVALGGAIVSAGLIEADALDRDDVVAYLDELAADNPDLREHVAGGGGLLDGLRMRSALTTGLLAGDDGPAAARGGLRALGVEQFPTGLGPALRDVACGPIDTPSPAGDDVGPATASRPGSLAELLAAAAGSRRAVHVHEVAPDRFVVYLPGPDGRAGNGLRLVGGDHTAYADRATRAIEAAVGVRGGSPSRGPARVLLVGCGQGGVTAIDVATRARSSAFAVDQVVTAGAPSALVPRVPDPTRVLSLEDRADPVALLGSLVNADAANRLTVVFDGGAQPGPDAYVAGARAADAADHPELRAELDRMRELGFLS